MTIRRSIRDEQITLKECITLMETIEGFAYRYVECMATKDLNGIQALMLLRLSDREETIGNLSNHYFGTNISYNVKKLFELGYLNRKDGDIDRRIGLVSLTPKGKKVCEEIEVRHLGIYRFLDEIKLAEMSKAIDSLRTAFLDGIEYPVRGVR